HPKSATYTAIFSLSLLWALTVHDAGDAVIDRIPRLGWDLDSGFTHTSQKIATPQSATYTAIFSLSLLRAMSLLWAQNQQLTQPFSACPCCGPPA
ncbi:MAG TPA: hypothetical protein PLG04_06695, partial [Anaerolineaceae bacterium]|nr:hypothetical protein [Anaerolineaceae bacterium]